MRRLRVQLTVLLGMLVVAWRAAIFLDASDQAEVRATESFDRVKELSRRWRGLFPLVQEVAAEYRAWVRTGQTERKARERGARAAARAVATGNADRHFQELWARQAALEDKLAQSQRTLCQQPGPDL
jgi:hypothetical protein